MDNFSYDLVRSTATNKDKSILCHLCEVRFTQRKALYVHLRRKHEVEPLKKKKGTVQCPECKNMFYDKYNLKRHCQKTHNLSALGEGNGILVRGRVLNMKQKPKFVLDAEDSHFCEVAGNSSETDIGSYSVEKHLEDVHFAESGVECAECGKHFADKQLLLSHTHSLDKYCDLEEILPDINSYKYEVAQYIRVNETGFVCEIYCNLSNRNETYQWLSKFQRKNQVTFRKMRSQCQPLKDLYSFLVDRYRCQHNTLPKKQSAPHAKHTGCSATVFIRLYQHETVPELSWSRIRIKHTHNHLKEEAAKFRDPIEEVVNKFRLMFEAGKGPKAAMNEHAKDLQILYGQKVFPDKGICPSSRWVYNFYRKLTKEAACENQLNTLKTIKRLNRKSKLSGIEIFQNFGGNDNVGDVSKKPDRVTVSWKRDNYLVAKESCERDSNTVAVNVTFDNSNDHVGLQANKSTAASVELIQNVDRALHDFEVALEQIRGRVSKDPFYFLNAIRNFVGVYDSALQGSRCLNSALYNFGNFRSSEGN